MDKFSLCLCAFVPLCLCAFVPLFLCSFVPLFLCAFVPLCLSSALYTCSERTTNSPFFMQNEPNFRKTQMSVNAFITMNYEQLTKNYEIKNEPKTNPNEPNFRKAKNERKCFYNKELQTINYEQ